MGRLNGLRSWTKEEMMAYLDWCQMEDTRIEARIAAQIGEGLSSGKRGTAYIWEDIQADLTEQQRLFSL